ncbi:unnamed protein product [Mycena citricolor]|uniref:RNA-dependent RNA polymerase n=1 Tax=Mycena citricolor TaxID=2018698 RepID=A0AAD2HDT0_9AGAR|nr:unnamed protein product [Mycena citricolor]
MSPISAESDQEDSDAELWKAFDDDTKFPSSNVLKRKRLFAAESTAYRGYRRVKQRRPAKSSIQFRTSSCRLDEAVTDPYIIAGFQTLEDEEAFRGISQLATGVIWETARLVSSERLTEARCDVLEGLQGSNADSVPRALQVLTKEQARGIEGDAAFSAERQAQCPWSELDREELALSADPLAGLGNCAEIEDGGYYGGKICFAGDIGLDKAGVVTILCKWASRFALGLSNSVPGPEIAPEHVEEIRDLGSSEGSNMTDGCGLSTPALHLKVRRMFNLESTPTALQMRYGGRKGMLLQFPGTNLDTVPKAAFRDPSQVKIRLGAQSQRHRANTTLDILRFSRTKTPTRISPEVIINLEHNGVPASVFLGLQERYLAAGVDDLVFWARTDYDGDNLDMFKLWSAVERSEGVHFARRVREDKGVARFRGLTSGYRDEMEEQHEEDEDEDGDLTGDRFDRVFHERSTAWWPDYISGCPSSLAETVMALLDAGFTPQSLPVLRDKLKQIALKKIKYRSHHFRYDVLQSASAFVVPDAWEVLGENEIHFKSSRREFNVGPDGLETDIILGDVLMTRNPCKVPTDVRKVKAVKKIELHDVVDVIVCSVKGSRRLIDYLAGGDYDGDTAVVIWDKSIVEPFRNAPERFSVEPRELAANFQRNDTSVSTFNINFSGTSEAEKVFELQSYLLGSLRNPSMIGRYSTFHDSSIVLNGYDHPETIMLAYKFCKILDSPKTGYLIKDHVYRNDLARPHGNPRGPKWKSKANESQFAHQSNRVPVQRRCTSAIPSLSRPFIMDVLQDEASRQEAVWLRSIEDLFRPFEQQSPHVLDDALADPWRKYASFADARAKEKDVGPRSDLGIIATHVQRLYVRHALVLSGRSAKELPSSPAKSLFTGKEITARQDALRTLSRDFASGPKLGELATMADEGLVARLRASYAYLYDFEKKVHADGWSRFPWNVAMGELCKIKASSLGSHKVVTTSFYERFRLSVKQMS